MPEQDGAPGDMFKGPIFSSFLIFIALLSPMLTIYQIVMETQAEVEDEDKALASRLASRALKGVKRFQNAILGRNQGKGEDSPGVEMNDLAIEAAYPEQNETEIYTENPMLRAQREAATDDGNLSLEQAYPGTAAANETETYTDNPMRKGRGRAQDRTQGSSKADPRPHRLSFRSRGDDPPLV